MGRRNLIWLAIIVVVAVVGSIVFEAVLVGVLLGLAVLVVSEIVERTRRRRVAADAGTEVPSLRSAVTSRRKRDDAR